MTEKYPIESYEQWSLEPGARMMFAGHTFGAHLFEKVRDRAIASIPQATEENAKAVAQEAIDHALWGCMALLDGYFRTMIDQDHKAVYELTMKIEDKAGNEIESIDLTALALQLGYANWLAGNFGQEIES